MFYLNEKQPFLLSIMMTLYVTMTMAQNVNCYTWWLLIHSTSEVKN